MLRVGAAQVEITPDREVFLAGSFHVRRTNKADCPLYASAVVIDDGQTTAAWVACDLLFLSDEVMTDLRARIAAAAGTFPARVFVSCTHTHNGPALFKCLPPIEPDRDLADRIKGRIIQAATRAAAARREARMGYARGTVAASYNRRYLTTDGKGWMCPGPQDTHVTGREGPEDQEVQAVWFETHDRQPIAVLVNFSAHPTLSFNEPVISADFPGHLRQRLCEALEPQLPVLYLQGACGNTSPIDFDRREYIPAGLAGARKTGRMIGEEVLRIMARGREALIENPKMAVREDCLTVPVRPAGPDDPSLEEATAFVQDHPWESLDPADGEATFRWYFARCMVDMETGPMKREAWPVAVSVLRLGPVVLAANPAELFVEYQLELKARAKMPILVSELTNGYCGYVITRRAFRNGSYEARRAFSSRLASQGGAMIVAQTLRLIEEANRS